MIDHDFINDLIDELDGYFDNNNHIKYDKGKNKILIDVDDGKKSDTVFVDVDYCYSLYSSGESLFDIALKVIGQINIINDVGYSDVSDYDHFMNSLNDYEFARKHLMIRVMNKKKNVQTLIDNHNIYFNMLNMCIVPVICINNNNEVISTAPITQELRDKWYEDIVITNNMIISDAMSNTKNILPVCSGAPDFSKYITNNPIPERCMLFLSRNISSLLLVTNKFETLGSSYMIDEELLYEIGQGKDLLVVPINIHEFMISTNTSGDMYDMLLDFLEYCNLNCNSEEYLSSEIFYYDASCKNLTFCELPFSENKFASKTKID